VNITPNLKKKGNGHASKKLPKSLSKEIDKSVPKVGNNVK